MMTIVSGLLDATKTRALWQAWRGLSKIWDLSDHEQERLLGQASGQAASWKHDNPTIPQPMADRMLELFECYKFMRICYGEDSRATASLRQPVSGGPFSGESALSHMMCGGKTAIRKVRDYFGHEAGWGEGLDPNDRLYFNLRLALAGKPAASTTTKPRGPS